MKELWIQYPVLPKENEITAMQMTKSPVRGQSRQPPVTQIILQANQGSNPGFTLESPRGLLKYSSVQPPPFPVDSD